MSGVIGALAGNRRYSPKNIAGLKLWMDPSNPANYTISSGSSISQLNDLSGNGNNATQATAAKQFTVQSAAQNGLNTLRVTAANSQVMNLTSVIDLSATGYTVCAIVRRGGPSGSNTAELLGYTASDATTIFEWYTDGTMYVGGPGEYANMLSAVTGSSYHQITFGYGPTTGTGFVYVDGTLKTLTVTSLAAQVEKIGVLGVGDSGTYGNFEFGEFYVFAGVLGNADLTNTHAALKSKWGTP